MFLDPRPDLMFPSSTVFAYYSGVVLRGLTQSRVIWLIAKCELAVCSVKCISSVAHEGVLSRQARDPPMLSHLGPLDPYNWACSSLSMTPCFSVSSTHPVLIQCFLTSRTTEVTKWTCRSPISPTCLCCRTPWLDLFFGYCKR